MDIHSFIKAATSAHETTTGKGLVLACFKRNKGLAYDTFTCPTCGQRKFFNHREFKDALSVREFFISGMCQECQDKVFEDK